MAAWQHQRRKRAAAIAAATGEQWRVANATTCRDVAQAQHPARWRRYGSHRAATYRHNIAHGG